MRFRVLGVGVDNVTRRQAIERIEQAIGRRDERAISVFFVNAHTLNLAVADPSYREVLNTADLVSGYNDITLNADGRSWINKTGTTKFCIRSSRDIDGNTPSGDEFIQVYMSETSGNTPSSQSLTHFRMKE